MNHFAISTISVQTAGTPFDIMTITITNTVGAQTGISNSFAVRAGAETGGNVTATPRFADENNNAVSTADNIVAWSTLNADGLFANSYQYNKCKRYSDNGLHYATCTVSVMTSSITPKNRLEMSNLY